MERELHRLKIADPDTAAFVAAKLETLSSPLTGAALALVVDDTIFGLTHTNGLARAVVEGHLNLVQHNAGLDLLTRFSKKLRPSAASTSGEAEVIALFFGSILLARRTDMEERFDLALGTMKQRGAFHSTHECFSLVTRFLGENDIQTAALFLALLHETFSAAMPFALHQTLFQALPRAFAPLSPQKRPWLIKGLMDMVSSDPLSFGHLINGLRNGLCFLTEQGFDLFLAKARKTIAKDRTRGERFLALESRVATDWFNEIKVVVVLDEIQAKLQRYMTLRTGIHFTIRPVQDNTGKICVSANGRELFLPNEFDRYSDKPSNKALATCLVRLEACCYEWGTFLFDMEKLVDRHMPSPAASKAQARFLSTAKKNSATNTTNDMTRFFDCFTDPALARCLFTIAEHARLMHRIRHFYPGMVKQVLPFLSEEARQMTSVTDAPSLALILYTRIAMDRDFAATLGKDFNDDGLLNRLETLATDIVNHKSGVEASGAFVVEAYPLVEQNPLPFLNFTAPFHRNIDERPYFKINGSTHARAKEIKKLLNNGNAKIYTSDIQQKLMENSDTISMDDIQALLQEHPENQEMDMGAVTAIPGLSEILPQNKNALASSPVFGENVSVYKEWDCTANDFRNDHVWVHETGFPECNNDFYQHTLNAHPGLVKRIRHTFELLKPETVKIIRQSLEGEEFDYRALVDFAVDKRARLTPKENIYIKRLKQERNVAVTLLIDQSRSTANQVLGSEKTVLDMEKEAVVLFCEALEVVGDNFSVAGYCGSGRHGVRYQTIKGFDDALDQGVKNRIDLITAQGSTRTGAGIRHAVSKLDPVPAKIKLILLLGDGFPNDVDYKHAYAVEDTRKAISEAQAKNIVLKAITVNISTLSGLNDLYGEFRHNVISDLKELPDRLLGIYSSLTK
ncbi:MAG: hypothetical protein JEZ12_16870 [Desulfobacterium sp.]|nr:hypothetical protein [Desulfobacterium sp.]